MAIQQRDPRGGSNRDARTNRRIKAREVRLVGVEGEQLGVLPIDQALARAQELGLDLVEVSPMAKPPVCKIMDYGKFKYLEKKKQNEAKKKQVVVQLKEVKLRPRTEEHDYATKIKKVREFLAESNKARITVMFRGREMSHRELGQKVLQRIIEDLRDVAVIESAPRMEGRQMFMILAPNPKMLQSQRDRAKAQAAKAAAGAAGGRSGAGRCPGRLRPPRPPRREAARPGRLRRRPRRRPRPSRTRPRRVDPNPRFTSTKERRDMPKLKTKSGAKKRFHAEEGRGREVPPRRRPPPRDVRQDEEAEGPPPRHGPPRADGREEDQGVLPVRPVANGRLDRSPARGERRPGRATHDAQAGNEERTARHST